MQKNTLSLQTNRTSLKDSVLNFLNFAVKYPVIEHAWLRALAKIEQQAGDQILSNITKNTPDNFKQKIIQHAKDEYRHQKIFETVQKNLPNQDLRDPYLEELFSEIIVSYVNGYFGNPELVKVKNRHAAYVHGAITIEQFPFQTYLIYAQKTSYKLVKSSITSVISDETDHIELGKEMFNELPKELQRPLKKLHSIEKQMTTLLMERLFTLSQKYIKSPKTRSSLFKTPSKTLWAFCLSEQLSFKIFKNSSTEPLISQYLELAKKNEKVFKRSILLDLKKERKKNNMEPKLLNAYSLYMDAFYEKIHRLILPEELKFLFSVLILRNSHINYLNSCITQSNDIGVSYALWLIINNESEALKKLKPNFQDELHKGVFELLSELEKDFHKILIRRVSKIYYAASAHSNPLQPQAN